MEIRRLLDNGMQHITAFLSASPASRSEMRRRQALRISVEDKRQQARLLKEASQKAETDEETGRLFELGNKREEQAEEMKHSLERHMVNKEAKVFRRQAQHDEAKRRGSQHRRPSSGEGE